MTANEEPRVYVRHVRACGYCLIPGVRDWVAHHGFDWRDFVRNGIPLSALSGINDAMCEKVIRKVLQEQK